MLDGCSVPNDASHIPTCSSEKQLSHQKHQAKDTRPPPLCVECIKLDNAKIVPRVEADALKGSISQAYQPGREATYIEFRFAAFQILLPLQMFAFLGWSTLYGPFIMHSSIQVPYTVANADLLQSSVSG